MKSSNLLSGFKNTRTLLKHFLNRYRKWNIRNYDISFEVLGVRRQTYDTCRTSIQQATRFFKTKKKKLDFRMRCWQIISGDFGKLTKARKQRKVKGEIDYIHSASTIFKVLTHLHKKIRLSILTSRWWNLRCFHLAVRDNLRQGHGHWGKY